MATRNSLIENATKLLDAASVPTTRREIEWLLMDAESVERVDLVSRPEAEVSSEAELRFNGFVARRLAREPIQYVLGYTEFYGHRFMVNPSVLIPRPETELLVDLALEFIRDRPAATVLDVGTGSGCVALSVKLARPDVQMAGLDISRGALETAKKNARALSADVTWLEGDLFDREKFEDAVSAFVPLDLLISNPPYVAPAERRTLAPEIVRYEPEIALFTGSDTLRPYTALADLGRSVLKGGSFAAVEIHADGADGVCGVFEREGYEQIRVHSDLAGRERVITAAPGH